MKHRGTVYSIQMARSNVCSWEWMLVSISDCWSRLKEWSDFNADNNRHNFYCENTCLATWPEVTFWPGGCDLWPLHSDSGLLSNRKVLEDELLLRGADWLILGLILFVLGEHRSLWSWPGSFQLLPISYCYGITMIVLWFSYGITMIVLW